MIKAYKGFDKDLKCRGFQFEIGKEYSEDEAKLCSKGFHACEYPLDCLSYYSPNESRYCEVKIDDNGERHSDDTKVCGKRIKIGAEIGIAGLVKASVEYVKSKCEKENKKNTRKDYSANSATGNRSANSATGYYSANVSTGSGCQNSSECEATISVGWGINNKCKGVIGSYLVLSEWSQDVNEKGYRKLIGARMELVDGEKIKADTYYILKNGEFVEVE